MGGKLGVLARDGFVFDTGPTCSRCRPSTATCSSTTGGPLEAEVDARARRPGLPLPVRRRHRARPAERVRAAASPRRVGRRARGRRRRRLDGVLRAGRRPSGTRPARPFLEAPLDGRRGPGPRRRPGCATCAPSPRGARCAGSGGGTCATRGSGRCSTGTPRTPAPTRAAPPPRSRPCRTSSRPSAPGTSRAVCAGSATPCTRGPSTGARRPHRRGRRRDPPRRRRAARRRRPARRRRAAAGRRRRRERRRCPRLPRPAAAAVAARPLAAPAPRRRRRSPASCCCSRCAVARRGSPTTPCCSPRTTTTSSTRSSAPGRTGAPAAPRARPDDLRQRPRRPGAAPRRRPRGLVRARQRPAPRTGDPGRSRLGRARGSPRPTPTGCSPSWRRAGSTCATGCCGARCARPPTSSGRPGSVGGSIYGTRSNGARAAFLRPANRSPVPGLFLVGGSSHPGGGLPLVGLSAAIVAGLVGPA